MLHFDYRTLPQGEDSGNKYILVLKDDFSGFVSCGRRRTQMPALWVSDQGTHFKNQVIEELPKSVGANHHFTTASCPWANGTVEVVIGCC
ncbi:hypothetical protein PHMEG_00025404 [Phytophthora megakarya]|uniref:Integrase catalytic domain-containing protein n=1 Tax=Phytophthora megakarya TaxID=4795 RepID=A0A225VBR7_9STRA|nr:hypothetical protein PHMEG_00025404 [Phytophthora megakarya]